jgi:hypothetical protein
VVAQQKLLVEQLGDAYVKFIDKFNTQKGLLFTRQAFLFILNEFSTNQFRGHFIPSLVFSL